MRIILLSAHPENTPQSIPLATSFLQAYQHKNGGRSGLDVLLYDSFIQQNFSELLDDIISMKPDAVGFSMYVWNRDFCSKLSKAIRVKKTDTIIFAGGPEATADPANILLEDNFDFLVCGEGEATFAEVCQSLVHKKNVANIPGVATIDKNREFHFTERPPISNLDEITSPWLSGVLKCDQYRGILWQLSRGCGFSCDFCFDSRGIHGVRRFSLERIEAELKHFAKNGVSQIFVLDSTFNQDLKRAKTILRLIIKNAPQIHFHFEVRSEFIDLELAELFSHVTCSLQIGLQSSNPEVLNGVGRNFNRNDFKKRVSLLNRTGATFGFDLIYGLPGETLQSFISSLNFATSLYPNGLDIFPLAILPGTRLAGRAKEVGVEYLSTPPYTVYKTDTMSPEGFKIARKLANACDIFYTRGKAVAWFLGALEPLKKTAGEFLLTFAQWMEENCGAESSETGGEFDDHKIWQMQRNFLTKIYSSSKKLQLLLPTLLDLVDYHFHYAACVMTPPPFSTSPIVTDKNCLALRLNLSDSARLATFNHEITELVDLPVNLCAFAANFSKSGSFVVIYTTAEGVMTESLDKIYFRFLKLCDGRSDVGTILKKLHIQKEDVLDFLKFALFEKILLKSEC